MKPSKLPSLWSTESSSPSSLSPMRDLNRLQRNIDRMFDEFLSPFWSRDVMQPSTSTSTTSMSMFTPLVDVSEADDHYLLSFDLPGIDRKDITIEMRDNQLIVCGERKTEHEEKRARGEYCERSFGSFERTFTLPPNVDPNKIEADYRNGVLHIALPKTAASKAHTIEIGQGKSGIFSRLLGKVTEPAEREIPTKKSA